MITTQLPLEIPHLDVSNVRRIISFNRINVFLEKSYQMNALISKSIKMSVSLVKLVTSFLKTELNVLPILKEFKDVKFISLKMIVFLVFLTFSKWNTLAIQWHKLLRIVNTMLLMDIARLVLLVTGTSKDNVLKLKL